MKNTLALSQLIVVAAATFQNEMYSKEKIVYVSEDGFTFLEENRARIHCKTIEGLKYHAITRTEALGTSENQETEILNSGDGAVDLQELKERYEELYGKAAHHNIGEEKLKSLIAEKESDLNAVNQSLKNDQNDQNLV